MYGRRQGNCEIVTSMMTASLVPWIEPRDHWVDEMIPGCHQGPSLTFTSLEGSSEPSGRNSKAPEENSHREEIWAY